MEEKRGYRGAIVAVKNSKLKQEASDVDDQWGDTKMKKKIKKMQRNSEGKGRGRQGESKSWENF